MKHNDRPPLAASTLRPNLLMLFRGSLPVVICPDCGTWRVLRRGMISAHRTDDEISRCPGSGQRLIIDLTYLDWQARLDAAVREAGQRRHNRARCIADPPTVQPVFRLADNR